MSDTYLDAEMLEELRSILDTEFPALINTYIQDSAQRMADIRAAFAAGEADEVRKAAHSLKGASANLGLVYLAEQCRVLEEAARAGNLDGQSTRVEQIGQERERAVGLLQGRL